MAYDPTNWKSGDVVTAAKLNKLEQGVANSGGVLVVGVNSETGVLDKTWQEIHDAAATGCVLLVNDMGEELINYPLVNVWQDSSEEHIYGASFFYYAGSNLIDFATDSADGYPAPIQP